jgi:cell wall assembly regulator SMI1
MKTQFSDGRTDTQYPNGFGALGSGGLPSSPPTTLTEAFVATQTEVFRQILQAQQQMAQQLQQMQPMHKSLNPSSLVHPKCLPRLI